MKKILIFILMLGLSPLANAELVYEIGGVQYPGGSIVPAFPCTIAIYNTLGFWGPADIGGVLSTGGAITDASVYGPALPGTWSVIDYGFVSALDSGLWADGYVAAVSNDVPAVAVTSVGKLFDFDYSGGFGLFQMYDTIGAAIGAPLILFPEPATLALIGLGGLLVRRKS